MIFADVELARRLERAEAVACKEYAVAGQRLHPESGAEWMECAGAYAVFNGADSPVTQSFGLGVFEEVDAAALERMERFFFERGAPADHEVSPFAGVEGLRLLCERGYRPLEMSNVLFRRLEPGEAAEEAAPAGIQVRAVGEEEAAVWTATNARGWAQEHPEVLPFVESTGAISFAREQSVCFLGEVDGVVGAAGALSIHEGVALFAGAATVPEMRRRGLQRALMETRKRYACERGCDLLMMVTEVGSRSQRNAERQGFRIAYTRVKWRLPRPDGWDTEAGERA